MYLVVVQFHVSQPLLHGLVSRVPTTTSWFSFMCPNHYFMVQFCMSQPLLHGLVSCVPTTTSWIGFMCPNYYFMDWFSFKCPNHCFMDQFHVSQLLLHGLVQFQVSQPLIHGLVSCVLTTISWISVPTTTSQISCKCPNNFLINQLMKRMKSFSHNNRKLFEANQ